MSVNTRLATLSPPGWDWICLASKYLKWLPVSQSNRLTSGGLFRGLSCLEGLLEQTFIHVSLLSKIWGGSCSFAPPKNHFGCSVKGVKWFWQEFVWFEKGHGDISTALPPRSTGNRVTFTSLIKSPNFVFIPNLIAKHDFHQAQHFKEKCPISRLTLTLRLPETCKRHLFENNLTSL